MGADRDSGILRRVARADPERAVAPPRQPHQRLLELQRSIGNQAFGRVLARGGGRTTPERAWRAPPGTQFGQLLERGGRFRFWGFDVDSAEPKEGFRFMLVGLAGVLKLAGGAAVTIEGHTSSSGGVAHNERLALRRAESIAGELEKLGLESWRIEWIAGRGEERLLLSENGDPARMALNRRVEVVVHYPDAPKPPPAPKFSPPEEAGIPCNYCDFEIRWMTGLKRAITLSYSHRDKGGPGTSFRPDWTPFQMAMRTEGFTQDEVDRLWNNYGGERMPYDQMSHFARMNREIEFFKKAKRLCDQTRRLEPTLLKQTSFVRPTQDVLVEPSRPPEPGLRPGRGPQH
jgi:outer membrane protein OmpA-like peptidoglycan-associated protein